MFSKSLTQFSVDGWGCVPSLLLDLRPNYGGGNKDNGDLPQKVPCSPLPHSVPLTLQQATTNTRLHRRLLDTQACPGQFLVGSLLLSPGSGVHKVLFVPSQSLFPQPCISSGGSMVGLMVTSKRAYATARSAAPRAPAPVAGHC